MSSEPQAPLTRVELIRDGNVATIEFSSEKGVQVLSSPVISAIGRIVEPIATDRAIRFVVFRATGKTFLAGADIKEMSHYTPDQAEVLSQHGHHVLDAIESLPQATIAAINGAALGGGCELSMACDFRIASANAKLGQPECQLGIIPGWGGTQRLPRLVGPAVARRLLYSGEAITAEEALRIGLLDEVVPTPDALAEAVNRWIARLTPGGPAAIRRIKQCLSGTDETNRFAACFNDAEAREGMAAFIEKRKAPWIA